MKKGNFSDIEFDLYNIDTAYISQPKTNGIGDMTVEIMLTEEDIETLLLRSESNTQEELEPIYCQQKSGSEYVVTPCCHIDHKEPDEHFMIKIEDYDYTNRCKTTTEIDDLSKVEKAKLVLTFDKVCRENKGASYDDVVRDIKLGAERVRGERTIDFIRVKKDKDKEEER